MKTPFELRPRRRFWVVTATIIVVALVAAGWIFYVSIGAD